MHIYTDTYSLCIHLAYSHLHCCHLPTCCRSEPLTPYQLHLRRPPPPGTSTWQERLQLAQRYMSPGHRAWLEELQEVAGRADGEAGMAEVGAMMRLCSALLCCAALLLDCVSVTSL
jgi:hypothetical protein